ncbi:MAG TPA: 3-deoxy-manno-octulosonate cytidylyltransferase [Flavipsychrobacter sp.]|nr:3-deoxy-manno-octulosonate cytidylyltransferase [Flavipsychrobacter sp.]
MKAIALIPARLEATRFPRKLLADLRGKSVLRRTYEAAVNTGLFDEVVVVADSDELIQEIEKHGGKAVKSRREYESGTDRIAEVAAELDADVFLNVQGDEPFTQKQPLADLLNVFRNDAEQKVRVASLCRKLSDGNLVADSNIVKVVFDKDQNSIYFSRSIIPFPRGKDIGVSHYQHIGVYAFRKVALMAFPQMPMTPLEVAEKIECLRFLENGIQLKMVETTFMGVGIDAPGDIARAEAFMDQYGLK